MSSDATMRANNVEDVLNSIPVLFGFVPKESIIGVSLLGPRRRFGFRMRIDLPAPGQRRAAIGLVVDRLTESGATEFLIVCFSEDPVYGRVLVSDVVDKLGSQRVPLAVWATKDRWWTFAQSEGTPWRENPEHPIRVAAVSEGMVIHPNRDSLETEFAHRCASDGSCAERSDKPITEFRVGNAGARSAIDMIYRCRDQFAASGVITPEDARNIVASLVKSSVRDAICADIRPDRARRELTWWANVSALVCGPWRARPLSLAAFCAWLAGDGVRARIAVDAALQVDDSYQLALLLGAVLDAAIGPDGWAA